MVKPATENGTFAANSKEFYLTEYQALRKEIEWLLADYRTLERNVVIAVGVTWGWLLHELQPKFPNLWWPWLVPILFAILGALRATGIIKAFGHFHDYISCLEASFSAKGDPGGWEHYSWEKTWTSKSAFLFWSILLGVTVSVAFYKYWH